MFSRILSRFQPKRVQDPVFGNLRFVKGRNQVRDCWEGEGAFEPLNVSVWYAVEADESGPGEAQRKLYRRIADQYREIFELVSPLLRREYEGSISPNCPADVTTVFFLDGFTIPNRESDDMEWDMSFGCDDDPDWSFTVMMKGWQPTGEVAVSH